MIDLSKFIGKRCIIQFRGDMWLVVHQVVEKVENKLIGRAEIMAVKDSKTGGIAPVPMPFIVGEVVEGPAVVYVDENKQKLQVTVNPDAILTVTVALEPVAPPDKPRILMPA